MKSYNGTGRVHSIESMGAVDGPGVRMVVFLQGCPLRCAYCHNPDTWNPSGGQEMAASDVVNKIIRYRPYFNGGGGVTLSGGEPMLQAEFVRDIFQRCHKEGIHTAVDTSGFYLNDVVREALSFTDLVLLDVKHTQPDKYKSLTGQDIKENRRFLEYLIAIQKPVWIRQVVVPGLTDTQESVDALLRYIKGAKVERVDLLPYHTMGVIKYKALGIPYSLEGTEPPSEQTMEQLRKYLDGQ